MRKLVLGAVAASLLVLGAPMASAAPVVRGGCEWFSGNDGDEVHVLIVAVDDETGEAYPIAGDCWIEVDGTEAAGTRLSFSGDGVVVDTMSFFAPAGPTVQLCWDWTADGTHSVGCKGPDVEFEFPPQEVIDLLDEILLLLDPVFVILDDLLQEIITIPDFVLCPIFASLSPGIPGVVDVDAEGDVSIAGIPVWDCPPYGS